MRNCQILSVFQSSLTSYSFRIWSYLDPEWFFPDPDPDPATSFRSDRIRSHITGRRNWLLPANLVSANRAVLATFLFISSLVNFLFSAWRRLYGISLLVSEGVWSGIWTTQNNHSYSQCCRSVPIFIIYGSIQIPDPAFQKSSGNPPSSLECCIKNI